MARIFSVPARERAARELGGYDEAWHTGSSRKQTLKGVLSNESSFFAQLHFVETLPSPCWKHQWENQKHTYMHTNDRPVGEGEVKCTYMKQK